MYGVAPFLDYELSFSNNQILIELVASLEALLAQIMPEEIKTQKHFGSSSELAENTKYIEALCLLLT